MTDLASETIVWNAPGSAVRMAVDRYLSPDFAALEEERLWPNVWQIACTVDHVAEPGDFFEYRAGPYSVLIVRGDDGELRAFQNVCRHRGNSICQGSGEGLTQIRCPWHRWTWDLRGQLREVPSRKWFGGLVNDDFPLFPVSVDAWARIVFVNLDPEAPPLLNYLEGIPADTAWADLDEFRCAAVTHTMVDCNWKVIADGFGETYHVQGIHPEMLGSMDDINTRQRLWEHHGVSYQQYGVPSPRLGRDATDRAVWDSFLETQGGRMGPDYVLGSPVPPVPDGQTMLDVIAQNIRSHHATLGTDLSRFTSEQMLMLAQYNVFPNATVLVWGEMLNVLLGLPGATPDQSELVTYTFYRAPSVDAPRTRPVDVTMPADVRGTGVIAQDISVLQTAQRGLRQPGLTHMTLSSEECRILNMHRNLERYLGIEPSQLEALGLNVDELLAREEIGDVVKRLARGTDRLDPELIESCYHPDGYDDHNVFRGSGTDFAKWVLDTLDVFDATMHFVGSPYIRLDGDIAQVDTYCVAHHLSKPDDSGEANDMILGLRYVDRFEKRDGAWLIAKRVRVDWVYRVPFSASDRSWFAEDFTVGARDHTDITYRGL